MKSAWICLIFTLFCGMSHAMTPVANSYKEEQNINLEMKNIYDNAQDQQFTQVKSTPNYQDIKDGQIVIWTSTYSTPVPQDVRLMLRIGTTIYFSPMFPILKGR